VAQQPPKNLFTLFGLHIGGDFGPFTFYKSKRRRLVFFKKAPPDKPPSEKQIAQRNRFRLVAAAWSTLTPYQRAQWTIAARRASLCMTGYDLFVHFKLKPDPHKLNHLQSITDTVLN